MGSETGKVHCTWCGAVMVGGRRYCAACGRPVAEPDLNDDDHYEEQPVARYRAQSATGGRNPTPSQSLCRETSEVDPEESPGLIGRLMAGLGLIIIIPLGIIVSLISLVLPLVIVLGLVRGPSDTWEMVSAWIPGLGSESAACEGFDDWYSESNNRLEQATGLLERYMSAETSDPATLRSLAAEVDALVEEQRRRSPPQEAVPLNDMMVETLELGAGALRMIASGDRSGVQDWVSETVQLTSAYEAEEERVFDACR